VRQFSRSLRPRVGEIHEVIGASASATEIKSELEWLRKTIQSTEQQLGQLAFALRLPEGTSPSAVIQAVPATHQPALQALMEENKERLRQLKNDIERAGISLHFAPFRKAHNPMHDTRKFAVLLAHSCKNARERLRSGLERLTECSVHEADNGNVALELFFRHLHDVVLVDACLPDCSGFDIIRCIRQAVPECAAVLLTASRDPFVEKVAQLVGAVRVCSETEEPGYVRELVRACSVENE
jgi:CheY-like chemotaxis protein